MKDGASSGDSRSTVRPRERWRLGRALVLALFVHGAVMAAIRAYVAGAAAHQLAVPIELGAPNLEWLAPAAVQPPAVDAADVSLAVGREPFSRPGGRVAFRERGSEAARPPAPGAASTGVARRTATNSAGAVARRGESFVGARSVGHWSFEPVFGPLTGSTATFGTASAQQSRSCRSALGGVAAFVHRLGGFARRHRPRWTTRRLSAQRVRRVFAFARPRRARG